MKKMIFAIVLFAVAAGGCGTRNTKSPEVTESKSPADAPAVGGQKDEHGCLSGAGYTWSAVRNDCIRLWEEGVAFVPSDTPDATSSTYVVFSADSSQAEVFLPADKRIVLKRGASGDVWTGTEDTSLAKEKSGWVLTVGKAVYNERKK